MLIIQLDPPAPFTASLRAVPSHEVLTVVRDVVSVLLQVTLDTLGVEGGMEAVRGSSLALDIRDVDNETEPRYRARFFQLRREGEGHPKPPPPLGPDRVIYAKRRCPTISSRCSITSRGSPLMRSSNAPYLPSAYRSATPS